MDIHLAISVIKSGASVGGPEELDAALRHVKNSTIGKKAKKQACLDEGVAPRFVWTGVGMW